MRLKFLLIILLLSTVLFAKDKRKIGLIPFENATGSSKYDWISYGFEYYLYSKLTALSGFYVPDKKTFHAALQKANYGKEPFSERMIFHIGKYSGVEVTISGSYKMYGNTLELTVVYSNAYNGTTILTDKISDSITNFFSIGRKIVSQVINLSGITVSPTEQRLLNFSLTNSIKAYGSFIKAYMESEKPNGRIEVVTGLFRRAIREDNKFWEAYYNLGIVYFNSGSYDKALQQFNKVIQALPNFDKSYFGRGLIYEKQNKYDLAIADFKKVTELNPNDFKPFFKLGEISLKQKQYKKAVTFLTQATKINPSYAPAYYILGNIYYEQNRYRKAIGYYKKATKLDDKNALYHLKLGDCYYRSEIYYNALNEINTSINLRSNDAMAYFLKGITIYKQAVLQELVNAFLEILSENNSKDKTNQPADLNKPKTSFNPVKKHQVYVDMAKAFKNAVDLKPNFMEATFNLALTYHEMGSTDEAKKYYLRTIQLRPNLIRVHLKLAELYTQTGRKRLALDQYRRIFYIDPRFFVNHPTLGKEFQYINVLAKFRKETENNLRHNPDNPQDNLVLARLFQAKGEFGKAANLARKVLNTSPNNHTAKEILKEIQKQ